VKDISSSTKETLLRLQKNEITEHYIYKRLARRMRGENQKVLLKIAEDERRHAETWQRYTKSATKPNMLKVLFYWYWPFCSGSPSR